MNLLARTPTRLALRPGPRLRTCDRAIWRRQSNGFPTVATFENPRCLMIFVELPGVSPVDVTVVVSRAAIDVIGDRAEGPFDREIPLPPTAIDEQAQVTFRGDLLIVTVPLAPARVRATRGAARGADRRADVTARTAAE